MVLASGERVLADAVVLAAGHSARELYQELLRCGATLAPKDFAVGFRIEHPQGEYLPISPHISPYLEHPQGESSVIISKQGVKSFSNQGVK